MHSERNNKVHTHSMVACMPYGLVSTTHIHVTLASGIRYTQHTHGPKPTIVCNDANTTNGG